MEDTWASRDLPILEAIVSAFNDPDPVPTADTRTDRALRPSGTGRRHGPARPGQYQAAAVGVSAAAGTATYPIIITDVTERARRLVGQWPTAESLAGQIAEALTEAAEHEPDPVRKGRLREARAVLGDTSRGVLVEVLSRIVERQAGLA